MPERLLAAVVAVPFVLGLSSAPADSGSEVFSFQDPAIVESSGLVVADGLFVTTNDSGDTGQVFVVDGQGRTVGLTRWSERPVDVESLAPAGRGRVWVGDIGDNAAARVSVSITRVPVGRGGRDEPGTTYDLVYPDGATDAETLMTDPTTGRVYVASKTFFGGTLYQAPSRLSEQRPNRLRPIGDVLPIATDGAFFPDGRHLVVRSYTSAEFYSFPDLTRIATVDLPAQQQGEGLAVDDRGRVFLSSEGQYSPVLELPLDRALRAELAGAPDPPKPTSSPDLSPDASDAPEVSPDLDSTPWPWLIGGAAWLVVVAVLLRSLRPR
ncbi:MAG: hypothetical protein F2667_01635 [Actinobacteria bacterium]|uniref:Unannotated protein n=1 Tax=freshwater metagenome TaxID=449393 RepID=A0A6J6NRA8_9ZZZZ|nr:hypothetical protein [Actinomycetota bacterium]